MLPGHPRVHQSVSLRYLRGIMADTRAPVAGGRASGRTVSFGWATRTSSCFFATWVDENSNLTRSFGAESDQQTATAAAGAGAASTRQHRVLARGAAVAAGRLHGSLDYPVVTDRYGQLADGYGVQDQPWIELISGTGKILFRHDGWITQPALDAAVTKAVK